MNGTVQVGGVLGYVTTLKFLGYVVSIAAWYKGRDQMEGSGNQSGLTLNVLYRRFVEINNEEHLV
jgi:hypothetical protein